MAVKKFGIDISRWQMSNFNIEAAKKSHNLDFVIIKFGGADGPGLYKDGQCENYYAQCEKIGMPKGAYFFGNARNVAEAKKEAEYFLSLLKGKKFEYPVFYDVESKAMLGLSKIDLTNVVTEFCDTVEKSGYWVGIYSSLSAFRSEVVDSSLKRFSHWVACWGPKNPPTIGSGSETQMWQESSSKVIQGRRVDTDYAYVDYPKYIKAKGLNGYPKPKKTKTVKEEK